MFKTCILKVGTSAVVTLSAEMREALVACKGAQSTWWVVMTDAGRSCCRTPNWMWLSQQRILSWMKTVTCYGRLREMAGLAALLGWRRASTLGFILTIEGDPLQRS